MYSLTSTSINSKSDTLCEHVTTICNSALNNAIYKELDANPHQWHDYYINILLHMYITLIGEESIDCKLINQTLHEPILWYEKTKQKCNNNFIGTQYEEFDAKNIDHIISVSYIKSLFCMKHPMEIEVHCAKKKLEEFKLPSIFKINDTQSDYTEHSLSLTLTNTLLMLYTIANHATYHYNQLKENNDADFDHNYIEKIEVTNDSVFYLHNLFTKKHNNKINQYVKDTFTGISTEKKMFIFHKKHENNISSDCNNFDNNEDSSTTDSSNSTDTEDE